MRLINVEDLETIALGAALLGAGGGGDPYIGKLIAINAIRECGPVTLIDPDEVPDEAFIMPIAMMGAPTVMTEKAIAGNEYKAVADIIERYYGKKVYATMPMEVGGMNSMLPIAAAARLGLPMVDVDGMGRAFPELQMVTFSIGGCEASPIAMSDEKGNTVIFNAITNKWSEDLARAVTMACGGEVTIALYCMDGKTMKEYGVKRTISLSDCIGKTIMGLKERKDGAPLENFVKDTGAFVMFKGKISDVLRETRNAFNFGRCELEGIGEDRGRKAFIEFQNENLVANVEGRILATTPDLICLVDCETFNPVPTDKLKYGKRVYLVGFPCNEKWRCPMGIELVGPRYFGLETDYTPIEERIKEEQA